MTSFFPDLNVWLALSVRDHSHNKEAFAWLNSLPLDAELIIGRYSQIGLLRLLTNESVMGEQTLTLNRAWSVYDHWLADPRVAFYPEPPELEAALRKASAPFGAKAASKWVGDCYLLAFANASKASLVTFDRGLFALARKQGNRAVNPRERD